MGLGPGGRLARHDRLNKLLLLLDCGATDDQHVWT